VVKKAQPDSTTSRPAAKPPPTAGPDDRRWLPVETFHGWLTERTGNRDFAAADLTRLVRTTVHTMQRYSVRYHRPDRPDLEWEQLPFSHWNERALISRSNGLGMVPAKHGVCIITPVFGLYVWGPNCEAFRPVSSGRSDNTGARSVPRQPTGPKSARDWQDLVLREQYCAAHAARPLLTGPELDQACIDCFGRSPGVSEINKFLQRVRGER
jgi:hypothetical protein